MSTNKWRRHDRREALRQLERLISDTERTAAMANDLPELEVNVEQVEDGGGGIDLVCPMCLGRGMRGQYAGCWVSCEWCGGDGTIDDPDDLRWIDTLEEYLTVLFKGLV